MIRDIRNIMMLLYVLILVLLFQEYDDCVWCEEGCLSFPDEFINVQRPDKIIVKYEDEDKKRS